MKKILRTISVLFGCLALLWFYLGFRMIYFGAHMEGVVGIVFVTALMAAVLGFLINRRSTWVFVLANLFLVFNILANLFDSNNFYGIVLLGLEFVILFLMWKRRQFWI